MTRRHSCQMPCLFWDHLFDWGDALSGEIKELLAIRKRNGIVAGTPLTILCADDDLYVARVGERLTVKLGPRIDIGDLKPKKEDGWVKAASGNDYAIWEKTGVQEEAQAQEQEQA
ncbi:hypothetical protein FOA52_009211 [Chlamydomonas sp. UWO 241]|nr:hypothetical protein FOA52_009211 [Chlamydomonas sp. UWO 241]